MKSSQDIHKLASTAGLLVLDAMVFHEVLARMDGRIPTISSILAKSNLKRALEESWSYILREINYEPIFDIALRILQSLPATPLINNGLKDLLNLAYDIASSHILLKHDLFGRIYHQLLLGKLVKYYATYYTSIPAARLLARLLVNLPSPLKLESVPPLYGNEELRVVDFACGSGTLLSALYKEIDVRHRLDSEEPRINEMHKYLLEQGIWGFDVLHHAIHLASTVLFLHNPSSVTTSRLYVLRLEKRGDKCYLGSIDFLADRALRREMLLEGGELESAERVSVRSREGEEVELPDFHICIMNPPFTRSVGGNLLFGALPKKQRRELQNRLSGLLRDLGISGIGQAGLGAVFVFLADKYLKIGGRIGLVLPRAVLSGVAWEKVREKLLRDYHIEYIITSYEGDNNWNFSENTSLSEILLVARKTRNGDNRKVTFFVNLWRRPKNELEAIHIGSQLAELYNTAKLYDIENSNASPYSLKMQGRKIGEVYSARITDMNIGRYNFFAQAELNRITTLLRNGILYLPTAGIIRRIPITTLSNLGAKIGPDRRQVHNAYRVEQIRHGCVYKAFWGHDSEQIRTIIQSPNACLEARNAEEARSLWSGSAKILIVERCWLTTYRLLSVFLNEPVLSNVWWPIRIDDEAGKILTLWLNSTLGLLLLLSGAEVTRGPWISFKKAELSNLLVLDIRRLKRENRNLILNRFNELSKMEFKPLPDEFRDPDTRRKIDELFNEALGIQYNLDSLYELLSVDPMITSKSLSQ